MSSLLASLPDAPSDDLNSDEQTDADMPLGEDGEESEQGNACDADTPRQDDAERPQQAEAQQPRRKLPWPRSTNDECENPQNSQDVHDSSDEEAKLKAQKKAGKDSKNTVPIDLEAMQLVHNIYSKKPGEGDGEDLPVDVAEQRRILKRPAAAKAAKQDSSVQKRPAAAKPAKQYSSVQQDSRDALATTQEISDEEPHERNMLDSQKQWLMEDYPEKKSDQFQFLLSRAADACPDVYKARSYKSKVVQTWQRGTWIFQIKDGATKVLAGQVTERQFGSAADAQRAAFVLLGLYDAGALPEDLMIVKLSGSLGKQIGQPKAKK